MKPLYALVATIALATAAVPVFAADTADHDQHHPDSAPAAKAPPAKSTKLADGKITKMDGQMKAMQEMHDKMMAAKTPEERNALMADHMKMMQKSMAMMNDMMGSPSDSKSPASPQMMQKQMDMMRMMMQMMMDQMSQQPPAK
ncbi:hypothetical protein EGT07_25670 [Herbaspirillum sp. HC18]|nr:hypothetical protein EGT07_25670 [Herbaspirillum sp. HC18]